MPIPASQVVNVTPNVLSAGGIGLQLLAVMLTSSTCIPIGTVPSFPNALAVSNYFGANANEYAEAAVYFGGFDNSNVKPGALLMAQYNASPVAAWLRGGNAAVLTLTQLQALTGSLTITVDGVVRTAASIVLSSANSFSAAAALIQTALDATEPTEAVVTGSIATTVLTVTAVTSGTVQPGQEVTGTGITTPPVILTQLTGATGGIGTYSLSSAPGTIASETLTLTSVPVVVTYDSISGGFVITSGITGVASSIGFATGTISSGLLLTQAAGAVTSQGAAPTTPAAFMNSLIQITTNWATFMTLFDPDGGSGNTLKQAFAAWTNAQNNRYGYVAWDTDITPTQSSNAATSLGQILIANNSSGTCPVWEPAGTNLHHAAFVCGYVASLDFNETNGRATLAFKGQSGLSPSVTSGTVAAYLDANGYSFYGDYATANDQFEFMYPGSVSGPFLWMDSYVDQIWLNNALQLDLMELVTQVKSIPYNTAGYSLIEASMADTINAGINFGAIVAGVTLSSLQVAEVNNAAGVKIDSVLYARGWYLQIRDPGAQARANRTSPACTFWYCDGGSVQQINLTSVEIQ